jgi:hypothetical protein
LVPDRAKLIELHEFFANLCFAGIKQEKAQDGPQVGLKIIFHRDPKSR